jgi:hypothetical protein
MDVSQLNKTLKPDDGFILIIHRAVIIQFPKWHIFSYSALQYLKI